MLSLNLFSLNLSSRLISITVAASLLSAIGFIGDSIVNPCSTEAWGNANQNNVRTVTFGRSGRADRLPS